MSRIETIEGQLRDAMKARAAERRDALRLILNALKSSEKELQRPLSDGSLKIVARGIKEDPAGQTT